MSKYKIEPWPPQPSGGMQTGKIPAGVKVTDTETGYWHYCNIYRSQHQNKDSAIKALQAYRRSTMTTNEPEVVAWYTPPTIGTLPVVALNDRSKRGEPLIRLADYQRLQADHERLQAECEQLRKHLQNLIDQTTPLEPEPGNPMWSRRIQLDEVTAERDQLRAERENLRKDADRYRPLLETVLREIPHRKWERGNAPGHCHSVPGVWDEDNGALAGKECAWCKVWNEAVSAMVPPKGGDT